MPATASRHGVRSRICSRPNLQQIPQDRRFRALFVAEPGNVLICADYASMELRAGAHILAIRR